MKLLDIKDLHVRITDGDTEILKGVTFSVEEGEIVALMGPNGSGKSTLAYALMGHPRYAITKGKATFLGKDVKDLSADERAKLGLFLSFQYPATVPGVTVQNFLRAAYNNMHDPLSVPKFRRYLKERMEALRMDASFAERYVNDGWSGGEKKRGEILQLSVLDPRLAILDETDSGLDIDAIRIVSEGVNRARDASPDMAVLIITHYKRILEYVKPDRVVILLDGKVVEQGGPELVDKLEAEGYDWVRDGETQKEMEK